MRMRTWGNILGRRSCCCWRRQSRLVSTSNTKTTQTQSQSSRSKHISQSISHSHHNDPDARIVAWPVAVCRPPTMLLAITTEGQKTRGEEAE